MKWLPKNSIVPRICEQKGQKWSVLGKKAKIDFFPYGYSRKRGSLGVWLVERR